MNLELLFCCASLSLVLVQIKTQGVRVLNSLLVIEWATLFSKIKKTSAQPHYAVWATRELNAELFVDWLSGCCVQYPSLCITDTYIGKIYHFSYDFCCFRNKFSFVFRRVTFGELNTFRFTSRPYFGHNIDNFFYLYLISNL